MEAKNDQAINSGNTSVCRQVAESVPVELDKRIMCFLNGVNLIANPKYPLTDLGAGQLFADCFTDEACYVAERCCWFVYIFGVWQPDIDGELTMALCKKLAIALKSYAKSIENESLRKFAERWQSRKSRETFIKDAQSCNYRHVREFDKDICVVNCKNGALHLDTMEFTQHRPSDLLTKSLNADYDPAAHDERFDRFIDEICSGDTDKSRFLQKSLGYALSGSNISVCRY